MKKPTKKKWMAYHTEMHILAKAAHKAHNALYNDYKELEAALILCERALEVRDAEAEEFAAKNARAVIAKAKGKPA